MRTATEVLRDEHALILGALDALERAAGRSLTGAGPPAPWWDEALAWLRAFADLNHHAKEETLLFPEMIRAGVPSVGGPIAVMLEEHERGRTLIRAIEQCAGASRATPALEYVALLRAHIEKENEVLFALADAVLTDEEQRALTERFAASEHTIGPGDADAAVDRLTAGLQVGVGV